MSSEQKKAVITVAGLIQSPKYSTRIDELFPTKEQSEAFKSALITLSRESNLVDCEPNSIIQSGIQAATMKLPVSKELGFAWVVPYVKRGGGKQAQFQIGYKGYVQLALRTNAYAKIAVNEVYQNEFTSWDRFTDTIVFTGEEPDYKKPVIGYYAFFALKSGYSKGLFWSIEKMTNHAATYSKSFKSEDGLWKKDPIGMGKKTMLKELLSKWGFLSPDVLPDFAAAMRYDQAIIDADGVPNYDDNPESTAGFEIPNAEVVDYKAIGGDAPRTKPRVQALTLALLAIVENDRDKYISGFNKFMDITSNSATKPELEKWLTDADINNVYQFAYFLTTGDLG